MRAGVPSDLIDAIYVMHFYPRRTQLTWHACSVVHCYLFNVKTVSAVLKSDRSDSACGENGRLKCFACVVLDSI